MDRWNGNNLLDEQCYLPLDRYNGKTQDKQSYLHLNRYNGKTQDEQNYLHFNRCNGEKSHDVHSYLHLV
jgi:hypothetical protein